MRRRQRTERILGVLSLAVGLALIAASVGVGAKSSSAASQKNFTNLRVVLDTIDYLDPAQAYTAQSAGIEFAAFDTLVTYAHKDKAHGGSKLVPGLAVSMPRISSNGKTYIFKLRPGLRYSNGKPLKASDFRYTIERLYPATSQGVGFYKAIVGASAYADRCLHSCSGHIGGIIANNAKRTVTFKLTTPRGDFLSTLALQFTVPVPAGTPAADQSTKNLPSIGPYHIINYTPNQGFTLVRNKYFKPTRFVPRPGPDKITVKLIGDANAATQQVINGQADYTNAAIPPDRIGAITRRYGKRLKLAQQANTYYFWMNNRSPVFKKLKARQAVEYAMNRTAMIRAVYGGLGRPTQQVLPPNYPQYKKLSLYKGPNLAKARQLVRQAGVNGAHITVWGRAVTDSQQAVTLMASTLESIGFKTTIKILPRATYYTTIGNASTPDRDIGWARWLEDYPHPSDWFDVLLNGNRITAQNNNNYSETNVGKINRMIERLNKLPLSAKVNKQWAQVDKLVMQNASWAPWVNRLFPQFFGAKVNMSSVVIHPIYEFDYSTVRSK
jgi:peptide/nickel transport system substrate-binding protein